jgi:hypothetical protein
VLILWKKKEEKNTIRRARYNEARSLEVFLVEIAGLVRRWTRIDTINGPVVEKHISSQTRDGQPVAHLGKFIARDIYQTFTKKSYFIQNKIFCLNEMPAQREMCIINIVIATNCLIHRQNICSQVMSTNHNSHIMESVAINYMRFRSDSLKSSWKNWIQSTVIKTMIIHCVYFK